MVKKRNLTTAAPKKGVTNRRQPGRSVKKTRVSKSSATPIEVPTESSVDEEDFVSELSSHESPSSNVDGSSLASSEAGETTGIRPLGSTESGGNPGSLESSIGPEQEDADIREWGFDDYSFFKTRVNVGLRSTDQGATV
ncbi:hypothetical protein GEMRC1_005408 [Eukaryota sp. GEM-RC1]